MSAVGRCNFRGPVPNCKVVVPRQKSAEGVDVEKLIRQIPTRIGSEDMRWSKYLAGPSDWCFLAASGNTGRTQKAHRVQSTCRCGLLPRSIRGTSTAPLKWNVGARRLVPAPHLKSCPQRKREKQCGPRGIGKSHFVALLHHHQNWSRHIPSNSNPQ